MAEATTLLPSLMCYLGRALHGHGPVLSPSSVLSISQVTFLEKWGQGEKLIQRGRLEDGTGKVLCGTLARWSDSSFLGNPGNSLRKRQAEQVAATLGFF